MFNHRLSIKKHSLYSIIWFCAIFLCPILGHSQHALINEGANISVIGPGNQSSNVGIAALGNFINNPNGSIELAGGHILVTGDWSNNANNTVFTNSTGTNQDGFVSLWHQTTPQIIEGTNPTRFENLILSKSRKTLDIDNSSVNGTLYIDAPFVLNANTFIINNPSPAGINYKSGFIKSETLPGLYSMIRWRIGSTTGTYSLPFGSDNLLPNNDLNFGIEILTAMNDSDYIDFATYPTDFYNFPLPLGASNLETEPGKVVDRYWIIKTNDFISRPDVNLTFTFTKEDVDPSYNTLNLQELKASRNNTNLGQWLDMAPIGTSAGNIVIANNISGNDLFESWTLLNIPGPLAEIFTPDAFSPNGDGLNDEFRPVFQVDFEVIEYNLYIYSRWGNEVFHTSDENIGWNGITTGTQGEPVIGVYTWIIVVKGKSKYNDEAEGETKKHVGRVTLFK